MKVKVVAVAVGYYHGEVKDEGVKFDFHYPLGAVRSGKDGGPLKLPSWLRLVDPKDMDKIAQAEKELKAAPKAAAKAEGKEKGVKDLV